MSLMEFLEAAGYRRVALMRTGVGHFEAAGTLAGHPVRILIDTGASGTVVGCDITRDLHLQMGKSGMSGAGTGASSLQVSQVANAELRVGGVLVRPKALYSMDLAHCNAALAQNGALPVQVILGSDVYDAHRAVIDYAGDSLFLRASGSSHAA